MLKKDTKGNIAGIEQVFGLSQKVRGALTTELQVATTNTRRNGACPKCRQDKTRVSNPTSLACYGIEFSFSQCNIPEDPYQPCDRCAKLSPNLRSQPCIRFDILGLNLHRKGIISCIYEEVTQEANFTPGSTMNDDLYRWSIRKWQLKEAKLLEHGNGFGSSQTLYITQDLGELMVTVAPFDPEPGDTTGFIWEDPEGNPRMMEMPAYFISDTQEASSNLEKFATRARSTYIDSYLADSNPIIRRTFKLALVYVASTKVWIAGRRALRSTELTYQSERPSLRRIELLGCNAIHREAMAHLLREEHVRISTSLGTWMSMERHYSRHSCHGHSNRRPYHQTPTYSNYAQVLARP